MNNPFTSDTYTASWLKFFNEGKDSFSFGAFKDINFIEDRKFKCYVNVGKNISNGMSYSINKGVDDYKGKVFLIHDVPSYFPEINDIADNLKLIEVGQYKGSYIDLSEMSSLDDVLLKCFNSKSRSRFKGRVRQIEKTFNISHKVYFGEMSRQDYDREMAALKLLIIKRFEELNKHNTVIPLWDFYQDVIYPLVVEKKALFNVVYNDDQPIAMSINFVYNNIVAVSIRSFNTDYYKYNLGGYEIYKMIDWCLQNNFDILDFSKGLKGYPYKKRWGTHFYQFNTHILYDAKSMKARTRAKLIKNMFRFKQYLRDKGINYLYTRVYYKFKALGKK